MKMGSISNHNHKITSLILVPQHPHSLSQNSNNFFPQFLNFSKFPFCSFKTTQKCITVTAKKKNPSSESALTPSIVDEISQDEDDDAENFQDFFDDDEGFDENDDFEDDYLEEEVKPRSGDGGGGGGISLAGTTWDKEVLTIAEEVTLSFDGELGIYAFKTLQNSVIRVRIERLSNKSGSPTMEDIEAFSKAYGERLNEAEAAGSIPVDISLEVSSPGLERVVRIPQDLERFKDRFMYGYKDVHKENHQIFEQLLIESLEKFIRREAQKRTLESDGDNDDSDYEDDPSRVLVGPNGSVYFGVNDTGNGIDNHYITISEATTSNKPDKAPANSDPEQSLENELAFLHKAKESGVVYLLGHGDIREIKKTHGLLKN